MSSNLRKEGYNFAKSYMMTLALIRPGQDIKYDIKWSHQRFGNGKTVKAVAYFPSGKQGWMSFSRKLAEPELQEYLEGVKEYRDEI